MTIQEIPAGAMDYAEKVCKSIVEATKHLFAIFFRREHNVVIIAVMHHEDGTKGFIVMSDVDDKQQMVDIMRHATNKAVDGSMIDGDDFNEPKH